LGVCSKINACYIMFAFSSTFAKIWTSNFNKVMWQRVVVHLGFVGNLGLFPAVKEFWKSVKNWQSYRDEFCVSTFLGHSVEANVVE